MDSCRLRNELLKLAPRLAEKYDQTYCLDEAEKCAGYNVAKAMGTSAVPMDLLPFEHDRAESILRAHSRWLDR